MGNSTQSSNIIKWMVIVGDFILLNVILFAFFQFVLKDQNWSEKDLDVFLLINNIAFLLSQFFFSTIIYQRLIGAGEVIRRIVGLTSLQAVVAYALLRIFGFSQPVGLIEFGIGTALFFSLLFVRLAERWFVNLYRQAGRNTRSVTFVGSDPELINVYERLKRDATLGYDVLGYYADDELGSMTHAIEGANRKSTTESSSESVEVDVEHAEKPKEVPIKKLGSMSEFIKGLNHAEDLVLGDELYLCISRRDRNIIRRVSQMCDRHMVRFYYVPVSVESIGLNLKREFLDDVEVYTTYELPLQKPVNRAVKRLFDIVFSLVFLIPTAIIFPFIFIIMKIQSPGPILFRQKRTGLDGKDFEVLKFRSMHVNADADKVQATKDDPRKYPFGNFMRKSNIDELPQFLNVLKGDMSIVGPRPHMLAHTEMYSSLIDKYMVRHFVKPGVTGWAQVTGFRGETKELWQMEGRVKRDIWYIEHWSFWLDVRIIWMTIETIFVHDKNAY